MSLGAQIIRPSADGLSRQMWSFGVIYSYENLLWMTYYGREKRVTKRHKFQPVECWNRYRCGSQWPPPYLEKMPIVPPDIIAEALAQVRAQITYVTETPQ